MPALRVARCKLRRILVAAGEAVDVTKARCKQRGAGLSKHVAHTFRAISTFASLGQVDLTIHQVNKPRLVQNSLHEHVSAQPGGEPEPQPR